jgi:hypothetical protein
VTVKRRSANRRGEHFSSFCVIVRKENSIIKKGVNNSTVAPKTGVKDIFNGFAMMIIMAILGLFISVLNLTNYSKNSPLRGEMNCKKMKKQKKNTCSIAEIVI